jgi:hypothetical protein
MPWTTVQQVTDLTGKTVDDVAVRVASAMIDTKAGTSEDMPQDSITARDRKTLARAAAWQAAWIAPKLNAGLLDQRESARGTTAAGVTDRREADVQIMYAPMALLELRNLSWFGTRHEDRRPTLPAPINFLNEASDACGTWTPLP